MKNKSRWSQKRSKVHSGVSLLLFGYSGLAFAGPSPQFVAAQESFGHGQPVSHNKLYSRAVTCAAVDSSGASSSPVYYDFSEGVFKYVELARQATALGDESGAKFQSIVEMPYNSTCFSSLGDRDCGGSYLELQVFKLTPGGDLIATTPRTRGHYEDRAPTTFRLDASGNMIGKQEVTNIFGRTKTQYLSCKDDPYPFLRGMDINAYNRRINQVIKSNSISQLSTKPSGFSAGDGSGTGNSPALRDGSGTGNTPRSGGAY